MGAARDRDGSQFEVERRTRDDGVVELSVHGELDLATVEGFEPALIGASRKLTGSGRVLRLTGAREQVRDLFRLIVLDEAAAIEFVDA